MLKSVRYVLCAHMETEIMKPYYINENPEVNRVYTDRKAIEESRGLTVGDVLRQHTRLMHLIKGTQ
jgi:hypothetical protein